MSSFVILNGFDRSGSSAISRTLASHPDIELIMQPFNSGFMRKRMYEVLDEKAQDNIAFSFFKALQNNELKEEFIQSHWHYEFSTTRRFVPGKIHLIKTTINHFAQKWMNEYFPDINVWGIWREPKDIVASIIHNGFYTKWYEHSVSEIIPTIINELELKSLFNRFIDELDTDVKNTSFLLAVRTYFFLKHLDRDKLIIYEKFKNNAEYLDRFTKYYGLDESNFYGIAQNDLNITGKLKSKKRQFIVNSSEVDFMDRIFESLYELKNTKFND